MPTPNDKYFCLLPTSSLEHLPKQAVRADFAWNLADAQEKESRWNSETLRIFPSPTCTELDCPTFRSQEKNSCNSPMNSNKFLFSKEGHHLSGFSDSCLSSNRLSNEKYSDSFPIASTRFQMHDKFQALFRPYDKEMLSKLDFKRNSKQKLSPSKYNGPFLHTSLPDNTPGFRFRHGLHMPLENSSLPSISNKKIPPNDSLSQEKNDADRSFLPPFSSHLTYRIQMDVDGYNSSHRCQNLQVKRMIFEPEKENRKERKLPQLGLNGSCHNDLYPSMFAIGKRRRTSSLAEDENTQLYDVKSPNKFYRRQDSVASRNSTDPCHHSHCGSISSTSSDTKNDSYSSTISSKISNRTSVSSFGRLSPDGSSPKIIEGINSPLATSQSSNQRHQGSSFRSTLQHKPSYDNRILGKITHQPLESVVYSQQNKNLPDSTRVFICECCPKKPKKFGNKVDLDAHEQEKQYECAYCRNRFKNKNEAERHQNSLHLRRHSWSCTALSGYAAAFYNSSIRSGEADTCGFCGEDFPRSRVDSGIFVITKHDWDNRINHLTEIHKFGECNHDKKFFRADHFRQHLKHSHAGTSGKWTNMLENACMRDEPVQNPIGSPVNINSGGSQISSCETVSAVEL